MLFRLLIYVVLAVVLYRAAKSWFDRSRYDDRRRSMRSHEQVDDVMIQDPVCGAYFPQGKAVAWNGPDQTLFFCSTQCRDHYLKNKA